MFVKAGFAAKKFLFHLAMQLWWLAWFRCFGKSGPTKSRAGFPTPIKRR